MMIAEAHTRAVVNHAPVSGQDVDIVLDQFAAVNERDFDRAMTFYADFGARE